ncbi:MAG: peptidylprolyl isomerase [Clostridia bacterium]|nr:peptidylprolyl isomerase [Clostridia bacterium]
MKNKKLALSIIALIFVLILGGFLAFGYYQKANYKLQRPVVSMEIEGYGTVKMELYPDMAPNTVRNFIKLINDGYYNGLTFHRVEENLIQGGDKQGDGSGETEACIDGEFSENGYDNTLKFERGTLGLARADYSAYYYYYGLDASVIKEGYNSGYAQFFIMTEPEENFDGYYTAFGKVTEGMEIVDAITKLETEVEKDEESGEETKTTKPVNPPVITNISVETFGEDYGEPKTHETFDINSYLMQKLYGISY